MEQRCCVLCEPFISGILGIGSPRPLISGCPLPPPPRHRTASLVPPTVALCSVCFQYFHDPKKLFFFTFSMFFFFFKVITEQVVIDANLPSVSKESVGRVGPTRAASGARCWGHCRSCPLGSGEVVCLLCFESGGVGGKDRRQTAKKKEKRKSHKRRVGRRGKGTPRRSSSPLEGGGQDRWAEDAARRRAGPPLLISRSFPVAGWRVPPCCAASRSSPGRRPASLPA